MVKRSPNFYKEHVMSILTGVRGGGERGKGKNEMLSGVGRWGISECFGRPVSIFFIKESWICAMTRHDAEPNINILLTRNLPFDSDSDSGLKSNNRTRGQFKCDVTWFCYFACAMRLLFHSLFTFSSCANKTGWLQNEYLNVNNYK